MLTVGRVLRCGECGGLDLLEVHTYITLQFLG